MNAAIRLLHLEDDPHDAERIRRALQDAGIASDIVRVRTTAEFTSALQQPRFDLVLCEYRLAGLDELRKVRQQHPDRPVSTMCLAG